VRDSTTLANAIPAVIKKNVAGDVLAQSGPMKLAPMLPIIWDRKNTLMKIVM
jgi:hypothetical protein